MPAKDPQLYLLHIRDCATRIIEYTAGHASEWTTTPIILDAVCRNLEIMVKPPANWTNPIGRRIRRFLGGA